VVQSPTPAETRTPVPPAEVEPVQPELGAQRPDARSPAPRAQSREPEVDHFDLAVRSHRLGDFDQALKHYLDVLAEDELNVEARNNLGLLYHERGMTDQAIEQFRRAIEINPRNITARSNAAVALTSAGRLAEARAELRAALALEPRNADLLVNMALVEKADRRSEQAIELLLRAVGSQPAHAAAHYNLAVLYEERDSLALAYDHYGAFLTYAGPEHRARLGDVQRRLSLIESRLDLRKP
jgi:Flp pilus assembly protein TadD